MDIAVIIIGALAILAAWDGWRRYCNRFASVDARFEAVDKALAVVAEKAAEARTVAGNATAQAKSAAMAVESIKASALPIRRMGR